MTLPKTPAQSLEPAVLWSMLDGADHLQDLAAYEKAGGYKQLKAALKRDRAELVEEIKEAGIRGRGGAGFPTGLKMSFIPKDSPKERYLVCNADESEPGTFKDREIIERLPHALIEGCLLGAFAIGGTYAFIYIRGEYFEPFEILRAAAEQAREKGYIGENVLGSGVSLSLVLHRGAGAYICGEETALLSSLNGERGQPTVKPPFPAVSGLYESPTLVNNVETLATLPRILDMGAPEYAKIGTGPTGAGTRVFSISGNVAKPGNFELPVGTPLSTLVNDLAGGVPDGRRVKAIIPGGSSTPILTADQIDTPLDFDAMAKLNTFLGSGAIIVLDERVCMVQLALRVAEFYRHESCGKCTPCREGTRWTTDVIARIESGEGRLQDVELLESINERILGNCLCPLGDAMAMPILSYLEHFRDEFVAHVEQGGCPHADSPLADICDEVMHHHGGSNVTWTGQLSVRRGHNLADEAAGKL